MVRNDKTYTLFVFRYLTNFIISNAKSNDNSNISFFFILVFYLSSIIPAYRQAGKIKHS